MLLYIHSIFITILIRLEQNLLFNWNVNQYVLPCYSHGILKENLSESGKDISVTVLRLFSRLQEDYINDTHNLLILNHSKLIKLMIYFVIINHQMQTKQNNNSVFHCLIKDVLYLFAFTNHFSAAIKTDFAFFLDWLK